MPNVLHAEFYRRRSLPGLEKVTVRQKFSNHTLSFLDYRVEDRKDYLLPPENTLVQVRWGSGPTGVSTTYGYVNHYETVTDEADRAFLRMVLLGTSKPMNAVNTSSWQGQSRSAVVRDIAARHRLRSVIHDHPYVVDNWASGTRSDFQCLKALSEESGYHLWVDGSTVWFVDPGKLVRDASSMTVPRIRRKTLRSVQVLGGSNIPGEVISSTRRVQFGLDYRTNEFFAATSGDPNNPTQVLQSSVNTYSEAQQIADAADRKQSDTYVLKSTFDGASSVHPGTLIQFESGRVNSDQAGLWLVAEATHEITPIDFSSKIVATRGADQQPLTRVQSTVRGASGLTQAVVRDGVTWEAALQEHVHV